MAGLAPDALTHQQLLRSMDALMDHQAAVDDCIAGLLRPLIDEELSVVFYDLTTVRAEGLSQQDADVRHFGMSKEGVIARQFMLGVVQSSEGMPIYHEVFEGNTAEAPTLEPTLKKVLERYPHIKRLVVVADRGLLSLDNLQALSKLPLADRPNALEFILAVPGAVMASSSRCWHPWPSGARRPARSSLSKCNGKAIAWWWPTTLCKRGSKPLSVSRALMC